jgi:hypothetical protein
MVTAKPRKSGKLPDQSPPQETQLPLPKPANVVFFGHYLWPEEAKKQGGFLPQLTKPPGPEYITDGAPPTGPDAEKIDIEWATFLVPAYLTFGAAAMTAADAASRNTGFPGVVYAVHATPNMVSLGNKAAVVGGIRWSQVLGWMQVPQDYSPPDMQPHERANMKEHFHKAFQASTDLFSPNKMATWALLGLAWRMLLVMNWPMLPVAPKMRILEGIDAIVCIDDAQVQARG